jgi:hypothetical protein
MAEFVNYKKRGFTLPSGCKDLIDVLVPSRRRSAVQMATGDFASLEIKEERFPTAGLEQIGRFVSMLLQSRGEMFTLSITAQGFEFPVTLYRSRSDQTAAFVLVTKQLTLEQSIRAYFEHEGIPVLSDLPPSDLAGGDAARGLAYPLPSEAPRAISVTTKLLRSVYGLSDESGMEFRFYEMETAV